jgi:DNA-binding transcriptional LysR family regulator
MRSSGLIELDAVLALARHRGYRAAATELGMWRSTLSQYSTGDLRKVS